MFDGIGFQASAKVVTTVLTFSVVRAFWVEVVNWSLQVSQGERLDSHDYMSVTNEIVPAGSQAC